MAMIAAKQLAQPSQLFGRFSYSLTNSVLASVALIGIFFAQSAQIDLPGAMDWLEGEGVTGVVNGAMLLAVSAELSFIAGVGLLLSACSIGLLEIVVHRKSST